MNRAVWLAAAGLAWLMQPCPLVGAATDEPAPPFKLARHGTRETVSLADLRGRIVVLDFFAHWCVPCARASAEIESGIQQWYEQRKGNAQGVPVQVLAVNVEAAEPGKTQAFIRRTGLKDVLDDPGGEVFLRYGGGALPFVVIIDGTGGATGTAPARVIYHKTGFDGLARLRQVIDSVEGQSQPAGAAGRRTVPGAAARAQAPAPLAPGGQAVQQLGLDSTMLIASDIWLTDETAEYRQTRPNSDLAFDLSHGHIELRYVPEFLGVEKPTHIETERYGFQTRGRFLANDRLTVLGNGGAYYGYMDYRSFWLGEHFRQLFQTHSEYQTPHPWGYNFGGGLRWEYVPAAGFLEGDLLYQRDIIAPGYDVVLVSPPPQLVRFRDTYDTVGGQVTLETVLSPRLRAQQQLQAIDTTDRQLRFAGQSCLNIALAEHWVSRLTLAGSEERPNFDSWSAGATLERDFNGAWFLSLLGRYYQDTGQIENALLAENTAAPPVRTVQIGFGLRWQGRKSSVKLVIGPYFSRYERPGPNALTFEHLYQSRDWLSTQLAFVHEF